MATTNKKAPGLLNDPWRTIETEPVAPKPQAPGASPGAVPGAVPVASTRRNGDTNESPRSIATIELKGYGGITVEDVTDTPMAAARLLEFCVDHRKDIESTLTEYGIVLAKLDLKQISNINFYIQRTDGWVLAIPGAATREVGRFHFIQAFIRMQSNPGLKKKLEEYRIRPYKV